VRRRTGQSRPLLRNRNIASIRDGRKVTAQAPEPAQRQHHASRWHMPKCATSVTAICAIGRPLTL